VEIFHADHPYTDVVMLCGPCWVMCVPWCYFKCTHGESSPVPWTTCQSYVHAMFQCGWSSPNFFPFLVPFGSVTT